MTCPAPLSLRSMFKAQYKCQVIIIYSSEAVSDSYQIYVKFLHLYISNQSILADQTYLDNYNRIYMLINIFEDLYLKK